MLFLQAIALEASVAACSSASRVGLAATAGVGVLTFKLQTRLPYKRMLVVRGVMVAWVLVVMVGTTVQIMQKVGWLPVTPIEGLHAAVLVGPLVRHLPTWQGVGLQAAALTFVMGGYVAVEWQRSRRRGRVIADPVPATGPLENAPTSSSRRPAIVRPPRARAATHHTEAGRSSPRIGEANLKPQTTQ